MTRRRLAAGAALVLIVAAVVIFVRLRDADDRPGPPVERILLQRRVESAEALLAAARAGSILGFEQLLATIDERLVRDLVEASLPYERLLDDRFRVRVDAARVRFRDGIALVELEARAWLAGRDESTAYADLRVYGGLHVVGVDPASGILQARIDVLAFQVPQVGVMGLSPPVRQIVERLADASLRDFEELASSLEIPVVVEQEVAIPAVEDDDVRIAAAVIPLRVVVRDVQAAAGKLWVVVGIDVNEPAGPDSTAPPETAALEPRLAGRAVRDPPAMAPRPGSASRPQDRAARPVGQAPSVLDEDPAVPDSADTPETAALRRRYVAARDSLAALASRDSIFLALAADTADVALGVRPALLDRLLEAVTASYLDRVELDLRLEEEEREVEDLEVDTPLGETELGDYVVNVVIHRVQGVLSARAPRVEFEGGDRLGIVVPLRILSGHGNASLDFTWDPEGIVDLACDDFTARLTVTGRVVPRDYEVSGAFRIGADEERVLVRPEFPEQKVRIAVDPSAATWSAVRRQLEELDEVEQCALAFEVVSPEDIVELLRGVAAKGFKVKVPTKLIPALELPAGLTEEVDVGGRRVRIGVRPAALRIDAGTLWYAARVDVAARPSREELARGPRPVGTRALGTRSAGR